MFAVSQDVDFDGEVFQILLMFDLTNFGRGLRAGLLMLSLEKEGERLEERTGHRP